MTNEYKDKYMKLQRRGETMKYDFTSYINRGEIGASKWMDMYARNPDVGNEIIPMSVADMDFVTCPEINEGICEFVNTQSLGYARPIDSYLESVVNFFINYHGYNAKKEWIVTTPGIVSALATSVRAFTKEGEGVIIFTPVYQPFYNVVQEQGRKVVNCPLIYKNNRYEIDFKLFEKLASDPDTKLLMLCNPQNPGGMVWCKEDLLKIAEIAEKEDLLVVSDEIHSDIVFEGNKHIVFGSVNDTIGNRSIICTAASKTFNIAGLQCSNIFIENEDIRNKFEQNNNGIGIERANILGLVATKAAYDNGLDWLEELKTVIVNNHKVVTEFFEGYNGIFEVMKAEASFTVWINFKNLNVKHEEFMSFLDKTCEFFPSNGLSFGENGRYFIRVNVGLPTEKLEENSNRVKDSLKTHYNI